MNKFRRKNKYLLHYVIVQIFLYKKGTGNKSQWKTEVMSINIKKKKTLHLYVLTEVMWRDEDRYPNQ